MQVPFHIFPSYTSRPVFVHFALQQNVFLKIRFNPAGSGAQESLLGKSVFIKSLKAYSPICSVLCAFI